MRLYNRTPGEPNPEPPTVSVNYTITFNKEVRGIDSSVKSTLWNSLHTRTLKSNLKNSQEALVQ